MPYGTYKGKVILVVTVVLTWALPALLLNDTTRCCSAILSLLFTPKTGLGSFLFKTEEIYSTYLVSTNLSIDIDLFS